MIIIISHSFFDGKSERKKLLMETLSYREMERAILEIQALPNKAQTIYSLVEIIYERTDTGNNKQTGQCDT